MSGVVEGALETGVGQNVPSIDELLAEAESEFDEDEQDQEDEQE